MPRISGFHLYKSKHFILNHKTTETFLSSKHLTEQISVGQFNLLLNFLSGTVKTFSCLLYWNYIQQHHFSVNCTLNIWFTGQPFCLYQMWLIVADYFRLLSYGYYNRASTDPHLIYMNLISLAKNWNKSKSFSDFPNPPPRDFQNLKVFLHGENRIWYWLLYKEIKDLIEGEEWCWWETGY